MENLKCLFANFPWDILFFMLGLGLLLWWLLSWLLGRMYKSRIAELEERIAYLEDENASLRKKYDDRIAYLEAELEACRKKKSDGGASKGGKAKGGAGAASAIVAGAAAKPKKDDLKIVEGIGPKIEQLFNKAGIYSFVDLASTSADRLKEILVDGGTRFQIHDPTTWPDQAAMARDGKWEELKKWQDELKGGRLD